MKILVADDEATSRLIAQAALQRLGHECRAVNDGAAAWDAFESFRPEVVISDWMMPGLTGLELCRKIRAQATGSYTYFIMVTTQGDLEAILQGMSAGADDYVVKPLDPEGLKARLIAAARITSLHHLLDEQRSELTRALADLNRLESDKAALLERAVETAEQERIRLAGELHDGAIQHLASIAYGIDRAIGRLMNGDSRGVGPLLDEAREQLSEEIDGLRRLMSGLRPPVLDEGGLDAAIVDYASGFSARTGVAHVIDCRDVPLAPGDELVIYRVVQEVLTNVAKHAGASLVTIRMTCSGDDVELTIEDDGRGFDTARATEFVRTNHFGLISMQERVERIGGTWHLQSAPDQGTRVQVVVPADQSSSPRLLATATASSFE